MNVKQLSWEDVELLAQSLPGEYQSARVFGIPRGGTHVAQALAGVFSHVHLVDSPSQADLIVDDLIDSGRTAERWNKAYSAPVWAMIDKRGIPDAPWYVFPWEAFGGEAAPAADNAQRLLQSLGVPLDPDGTRDTPERMVRSLVELTRGYEDDPSEILSKRFPVDRADEMIVVRGIGFWSLCEHHVLPFHGTVDVGYIPGESVVGLSKLARLVHCFARRLQIQERLTQQIANAIRDELGSIGVGVVVRATHLCMAMRGVRTPAEMVTSSMLGVLRDKPEARAEFLALSGGVSR